MTGRRIASLMAMLIASAPSLAAAQAPPVQEPLDGAQASKIDGRGGCFFITQMQDDHALGDRSVLFRVNVSDVWRMDFAQQCPELTYPDPKLIITPFGGEGLICHALDIDVKVGEQSPGSFAVPCIPSALYKLTPAEVSAIPKKDIP